MTGYGTVLKSEFFSEGGKAVAKRLYFDQGWGRKGLAIERLCNELAELREKIEALEAAHRPDKLDRLIALDRNDNSSLVERVATTLRQLQVDSPWIPRYDPEARAAIREVAAAARAQDSKHRDSSGVPELVTWETVALWLEQEAGR